MKATSTVRFALLFSTTVKGLIMECFSCVSNSNWSYYMERIPGLKLLNGSEAIPVAPIACTFDPMRIYADRTSVVCNDYCIKWASVKILDDGGLEVNFLRGCYENIIRSDVERPAARCYQTPNDFTHKQNVEYISTCYCKGFMCNESTIPILNVVSTTIFLVFALSIL
ncbi:hypothetical protein DICVIV_00376 [Dictyocaulus viviparus]|uniref:Protein quiver n=1 Tax=Dictyocaulus viviparus TaxID=29172 RepID=A0A0D8Y9C1_DICVI|nr:hypothetical protein DICVIV_00376 [Dictyocaulus viviparus]